MFAATTYSTPPSPWPLAGCLVVIHGTLLVTDHVHSRPAVTARRPVPPEAPTDDIVFTTVIPHLSSDGPVVVVDEVPQPVASRAIARVRQWKANFIFVYTFNTFFFR